jgi:peptidoglycan hydrolase-like protein with peptidoglycan-binding domain
VVTVGLNGHPIKTLQYLLRARGHSVAVDGDFGPQTNGAVKMFQTSKGFAATGTVDAQTWGALIVQVQKGSHGDAVRGVQEEFQFRNESGNPNQACRWMAILDRRPTRGSGDFSRPSRSTFQQWSSMELSAR